MGPVQASLQRAERDLLAARMAQDATPERCRNTLKALHEESERCGKCTCGTHNADISTA